MPQLQVIQVQSVLLFPAALLALLKGFGSGWPVKGRHSYRNSISAARRSLVLVPLQLKVAEWLALCCTDGKRVLLVGVSGAVGTALQCMLQKEGAVTMSCWWTSPQLQTKVSPLLLASAKASFCIHLLAEKWCSGKQGFLLEYYICSSSCYNFIIFTLVTVSKEFRSTV